MLKHLFTSKARIKLLTKFLLNPGEEFFVRELTRDLDEQINSVRRELENLKKLGLLRARSKARRKYYSVNTDHILYEDLRNIILKATHSFDTLVKQITKLGEVEFILFSGSFLQKSTPIDLLVVGKMPEQDLENYLDGLNNEPAVRFSILPTEDFVYRLKCRDQFIMDLVQDEGNVIGLNKLTEYFS